MWGTVLFRLGKIFKDDVYRNRLAYIISWVIIELFTSILWSSGYLLSVCVQVKLSPALLPRESAAWRHKHGFAVKTWRSISIDCIIHWLTYQPLSVHIKHIVDFAFLRLSNKPLQVSPTWVNLSIYCDFHMSKRILDVLCFTRVGLSFFKSHVSRS